MTKNTGVEEKIQTKLKLKSTSGVSTNDFEPVEIYYTHKDVKRIVSTHVQQAVDKARAEERALSIKEFLQEAKTLGLISEHSDLDELAKEKNENTKLYTRERKMG